MNQIRAQNAVRQSEPTIRLLLFSPPQISNFGGASPAPVDGRCCIIYYWLLAQNVVRQSCRYVQGVAEYLCMMYHIDCILPVHKEQVSSNFEEDSDGKQSYVPGPLPIEGRAGASP
jgi:hypothetical protein